MPFPIASFEKKLSQSPALAPRLLEKTFDELDTAREWMLLLGRKTAREKLATFLHMLATRMMRLQLMSAEQHIQFELPLTRKVLSDYLGLTMETVSRQLSLLSMDNIISIKGQRQITIHDMPALVAEMSKNRPNKKIKSVIMQKTRCGYATCCEKMRHAIWHSYFAEI